MTRQAAQNAHTGATVEFKVHFRTAHRGRRRLKQGARAIPKPVETGRIPRISRLMALAIHFDGLIRKGAIRDYADIARLGGVSRARASQIMGLLNLAPDIQEEILLAGRVEEAADPLTERRMRCIIIETNWVCQRHLWTELVRGDVRADNPAQDIRPRDKEPHDPLRQKISVRVAPRGFRARAGGDLQTRVTTRTRRPKKGAI